jgi:hypothetical protein
VLGLALLAMAEPLGSQMAGRVLEHLLQYGDPPVRRAVPLAISMLHISNPDVLVMDTLSRLSHDQDSEVANNAIVGLGLLGAGEQIRLAAGIRAASTGRRVDRLPPGGGGGGGGNRDEIRCGTYCLGWKIPESRTCRKAFLRDTRGGPRMYGPACKPSTALRWCQSRCVPNSCGSVCLSVSAGLGVHYAKP